jgi:hypothetical protein
MAGWLGGVRRGLARLVRGRRAEPPAPVLRPREPAWPEEVTRGWLAATDPEEMLRQLADGASERKLRLWAVACCRPLAGLIDEDWCAKCLDVCERFADERASAAELRAEEQALDRLEVVEFAKALALRTLALLASQQAASRQAAQAAAIFGSRQAADAVEEFAIRGGAQDPQTGLSVHRRERARQAALLREIFGNPFRPGVIDPLWLSANDGAALDLARTIDETGNFDAMPILADALEEAGCADSDVLWHCRDGKNHVRGCWALDLVLRKG